MTEEYKSFLDPLNEADDAVRATARFIDKIASSLQFVGNQALADKLGLAADDLRFAVERIESGKQMALNSYLGAANQGTTNMLNAALAVAAHTARQGA